jgi:hypothetical protein
VNLMIRTAVERWAATPNSGFAAASRVRAGQATERDRLAAELEEEQRGFGEVAIRWRTFGADQWAVMTEEHDAIVARLEAELGALDAALDEPPLPSDVQWERLTGDERRALAARALRVPVKVAPGNGGGAARTATERIKLRLRT